MTTAIGIDPGDSCGFAIVTSSGVHFAEQVTPELLTRRLRHTLATLRDDDKLSTLAGIFCERFISSGRPGRTHQPTAQQVIGVVLSVAAEFDVEVTLQSPGDAKHFAPNSLLRDLGMHKTGTEVRQRDANDANDATRHALLGLAARNVRAYDALLRSCHNLDTG